MKLDRRITIQTASTTQDANYGTPVKTWGTLATVWANIQDVLPSKSEANANDIRIATKRVRIRIRYLSTVTSAMRILLTDRSSQILQIVSPPAEIGRRDYMELICENYTSTGEGA